MKEPIGTLGYRSYLFKSVHILTLSMLDYDGAACNGRVPMLFFIGKMQVTIGPRGREVLHHCLSGVILKEEDESVLFIFF